MAAPAPMRQRPARALPSLLSLAGPPTPQQAMTGPDSGMVEESGEEGASSSSSSSAGGTLGGAVGSLLLPEDMPRRRVATVRWQPPSPTKDRGSRSGAGGGGGGGV